MDEHVEDDWRACPITNRGADAMELLDAAEAVLLVQDRIPRRVHQHRVVDGDAALRVIGDAEDAIKRGKRIDARLRHHDVCVALQGSHRWHFHRTNRRGDDD